MQSQGTERSQSTLQVGLHICINLSRYWFCFKNRGNDKLLAISKLSSSMLLYMAIGRQPSTEVLSGIFFIVNFYAEPTVHEHFT